MIKREIESKKSIKVKGLIKEVNDNEIIIEDKKKDKVKTDKFSLSEFEPFINTAINFTISKSIKGTVQSIDDNGVNIFDDKNEQYLTITLDDFKSFLESNISFGIFEFSKNEVENFDE